MYVSYLMLAFLGGYELAKKINPDGTALEYTAMGTGIGYLISGWITYLVSYAAKVFFDLPNPKMYGNAAAAVVMFLIIIFAIKNEKTKVNSIKEWIGFGLLFLAILASMFYVFNIKDGMLRSGATVFSDYAPHTAMIRSFAWHDNFPTQYPHYGGKDIKYHFMFQFLVGNLEYLGMRIDWAFNLTSAASLWGFLVLLYNFAKKVTNNTAAGVITVIMFFCRSSFAGLEKLVEAVFSKDNFLQNSSFIGYTLHEDWGLWNYNVFLNQRHFGFGLLIAMIVISYFSQYIDWIDEIEGGIKEIVKSSFIERDAWLPENCHNAVISACMGVLLGGIAFWNGAVVVGTLLILLGFAVFAKHKLNFAIMASVTLILTLLQTHFFTESGIGAKFLFGFIADDKSLGGVIIYLLQLSGIFFIGIAISLFILKGSKRIMTISFLLPVFFAFTISMTPDVTVNHKYIMIAVIFLNIIWADMLTRLFRRGFIEVDISVLLFVILTFTGAFDLLTIYNADKTTININTESRLTEWLKENVKENDLVMVNNDSMSETSLAGVMMYNGWPYYAWSAGYDTDWRDKQVDDIFIEKNKDILKRRLKNENINYIVIDRNSDRDDSVIKDTFECVFKEDGNRVYKVE